MVLAEWAGLSLSRSSFFPSLCFSLLSLALAASHHNYISLLPSLSLLHSSLLPSSSVTHTTLTFTFSLLPPPSLCLAVNGAKLVFLYPSLPPLLPRSAVNELHVEGKILG